jgi:tetratricopeptide (TPR) repeat protein
LIPILLALAAAQATPPSDEARFQSCTALIKTAPEKAVEAASEWRIAGGGAFARQCLGLAYAAMERWAPAATAFEQAARDAEKAKDASAADFWVQSGNGWLAAGDGLKARQAFDAALATTALTPELRGEVYLDRGRAGVQLGDLAGARADIDKGLTLVPSDPFGWYLSSALALREERLPRAKEDVARAISLAPDDGDVLLHAGNVAGASGDTQGAIAFYTKAVKAAPNSAAGKAAQAALAANAATAPAPVTEKK